MIHIHYQLTNQFPCPGPRRRFAVLNHSPLSPENAPLHISTGCVLAVYFQFNLGIWRCIHIVPIIRQPNSQFQAAIQVPCRIRHLMILKTTVNSRNLEMMIGIQSDVLDWDRKLNAIAEGVRVLVLVAVLILRWLLHLELDSPLGSTLLLLHKHHGMIKYREGVGNRDAFLVS